MTEAQRFVAIPKRPLRLAERVRNDGRRDLLAGCVPIVLDAVSDWWADPQRPEYPKWPESLFDKWSFSRSPWPNVWAEFLCYASTGERFDVGLSIREYPARRITSAPMSAATVSHCRIVRGFPEGALTNGVWWASESDGKLAPHPESAGKAWLALDRDSSVDMAEGYLAIIQRWRLFLAFLSVKNVGTADIAIPRAQRRRFALKGDGPLAWVKYKTLTVSLPSPAKGNGDGSAGDYSADSFQRPVPFHMVRGTFADYRNGPGLFGNPAWRTIVWRPMHFRGLQRCGAIAKTYEAKVNEDKGGA